jgi:hypothetical protein
MKTLSVALLAVFASLVGFISSANVPQLHALYTRSKTVQTDKAVAICTGEFAYSYHRHMNCRGIRACKADKIWLTAIEAKRIPRNPCGICKPL